MEKYKSNCLECPCFAEGAAEGLVKEKCGSCEQFTKEDFALLFYQYYAGRHISVNSGALSFPDGLLDRIFELHYEGVSTGDIVRKVNSEFPRIKNGHKKSWVNYEQVKFVIEEKYRGKVSREQVKASKARVRAKLGLSDE